MMVQAFIIAKRYLFVVLLTACISNLAAQNAALSKIAFGSCGHQDHPLPVYDLIVKHRPDLFVFLGDNIYGDTDNMDTLRAKYARLAAHKGFQQLIKTTKTLAIWDDHDYGMNDAGRHYAFKDSTKEIFLKFFNEPVNSARRKHAGIYDAHIYNCNGKKLQVILTDNRTFRDDLILYQGEKKNDERYFYTPDYSPQPSKDSTMLGAEQWAWLEEQLKQPADLRLICSGSQFSIEYNGYESWANFPHEQRKMLDLIKKTKANGVMFLSGDVHYAEISKLTDPGLYPIYDVTASGLSSTWLFATPNNNRIEGPIMENHFGMLTINWKLTDPTIKMEIWDVSNNQRIEHTVKLSELSFKK
ncbi:MAG: hypothetical protein RLY16_1247 [Bacteroidota bacterium]|jgi:alkaline phosphatase D